MDQGASQLFGRVVNILIDQINKHLGYVTFSSKHIVDMRNKMNVLEGKSDDVKRHMETNKKDNKEIPARVEAWLGEVENVKKEVEKISSNGIGCLNMKKRYRAGRNALKTINSIECLTNEEKEISWRDAKIPLGRVDSKLTSTNAPSTSVANDFESREENFKKALKFLQQDDKDGQVIALCGMGGVGKTTMMEQLKKVAHDSKMFHWIVKAVIGQNPNILSIQKDIAVYIGDDDLPEASISVRADHLNNKLVKLSQAKQKILIILDDIWENIELKDIGLRSPLPNGIKLFLTSRDSRVCAQIALDADSVLQEVKVDVLKEAEAHKFFSQITGVLEENDPDKYLIGCEIVKRCGGLPLAIRLIASTLKSKEDYEWKNSLNRLKNNDLDKNVQEIIKISYEYIEENEDKQIFLHCSLFPEDSNISIEILTRQAWGLELLTNVSTLREARDRTNTCVQNLIKANLLISSDHVGFVKMHDLVLAFVLGVSKGDLGWIVNHGDASKQDRDGMGQSCKRISLTCRGLSEFPRDFTYPNLSLLQLMHGDMSLTFPEDFYENMENLNVISYYNMQYPRLPTSLANLRSLCLHKCRLMFDCSFVGDLLNLEVLSFAYCDIRKLPSKIGNLKRLKLLDLTGCIDLHIEDGVFKHLENLEELYMRVSKGKAIRFTDANFEELKMLSNKLCALEVELIEKNTWLESLSFKQLDKFKISIGSLMIEEEYKEDIYLFKKTLKLVTNHSNDLLNCNIDELFKKTEKLHLHVKDMIGLQDIVSFHDQHSFCYLKDLWVSKCVNLKYLFPVCVANGLSKLERLTVSSCSVLEALVHDDHRKEINSGCEMIKFEKLKFLSLQHLPKLERLFDIDNVVQLPQLVELEVDDLPKFTSIFHDRNNLLNSQVQISELRKLKVKSMEKLTQIWECGSEEEVNNNVSMLREVEVKGCDSLVNLFPINPLRLMKHLERIKVKKCNSIEVIFNIDLGCAGEVEQDRNSNLKKVQVFDSEKVREVWRIKGGENNILHGFEAVEEICISGCNRFRNVFTPTNIKFIIRAVVDICGESGRSKVTTISCEGFPYHLSNLDLRQSEGPEVVFEISSNGESAAIQDTRQQIPLFPYLESLRLYDMEKVTHVWKCDNWNKFLILDHKQHQQSSFHNLKTIRIKGCNKIKYLLSPLMAKLLSNLKKIRIEKCEGIEEVVSSRDDKDEEMVTSSYIHTPTEFFPHLHSLSFSNLIKLKRIGGADFKLSQVSVASWSLCQYSREIVIHSCNSLSSVVPSYVVGQIQNLQVLRVWCCESLIEVFETQGINNKNGGSSTNTDEGNDVSNTTIPRLDTANVHRLSSLKTLVIVSCNLLQLVLTFSTLESLKHLEELTIESCQSLKVIVKEEKKGHRKEVDFPRVKSLKLHKLPNLVGFYLGMNDFQWPSLEKVMLDYCPNMMVFTSGKSTAPKLKYMHTSLGKHSLECGINFHVTTNQLPNSESITLDRLLAWSFHNLVEIEMEFNDDYKCIIPSNELTQLQKLERIRVEESDVEEVFGVSETIAEIPSLTQVELYRLDCLKYIWKSNDDGRTLLKFPNLTTLSIDWCRSLEHVFTSSMASSLLQLQDLRISKCWNLKVIVKEEESEVESECHAKVKEVVLPCLKSLKLEWLKSLKGFCLGKDAFSLPSLHTLEINECPEIIVFTNGHLDTPALNVIDTSLGRCYVEEDLNSFIKSKQQEGFQL